MRISDWSSDVCSTELRAEQLGSCVGQLAEANLTKVMIEYEGHVATLNTRPLTAIVLEGLLRRQLDSVNMVNAPLVAKERNIEVSEVKHDREGDYKTLMKVKIHADKARHLSGPGQEERRGGTECG